MTQTNAYYIDGALCRIVGPGLVFRSSDRMLGFYPPMRRYPPASSTGEDGTTVAWRTAEEVAQRAGVDTAVVRQRLVERWSGPDILKPEPWSRVVRSRRNGILHNGVTYTIHQIARMHECKAQNIEARLLAGWSDADVVTSPKRARTASGVTVSSLEAAGKPVPTTPTIGPRGRPQGVFVWDGVLDTVYGHVRRFNAKFPSYRDDRHRKQLHLCVQTVIKRIAEGESLEWAFDPKRKKRSDAGTHRGPTTKGTKYDPPRPHRWDTNPSVQEA